MTRRSRMARRGSTPRLLGLLAVSSYLVLPGTVPIAAAQEAFALGHGGRVRAVAGGSLELGPVGAG